MPQPKHRLPSRDDESIKYLLSEHGLRVTSQRMLLLKELSKLKTPASHAELTQRLSRTSLDRATIYRNLLTLSEAGVLIRVQLGDQVWRYELPRGEPITHARHPHFVCISCGALNCLPENAVQLKGEALKYKIAETQLRGYCGTCRRSR